MRFIMEHNLLLWAGAILYCFACKYLLQMGLKSHADKASGRESHAKYPVTYFKWLAIQLVPLIIAGFAKHDFFIIGTRFILLACVMICYIAVTDEDGIFTYEEYGDKIWWSLVIIIGFVLCYGEIKPFRQLIVNMKDILGYFVLITMLTYIALGQISAIRGLFHIVKHKKARMKGLDLQLCRLGAFVFSAIHYYVEHGPTDSFFLVNLLGSVGSAVSVTLYLLATPDDQNPVIG